MKFALETQIQFLSEKRTEPYKGTVMGVSELKIGSEAKSISKQSALLVDELMWCGGHES